jgi:hypothetical protein
MQIRASDRWCITALFALLLIFYPGLFLAKIGSLPGDHWLQHYPWSYLLHSSLRNFQLPFWTPSFHCGFPIAAESQIGIFYLPNLVLFALLPFKIAYSYLNVFHFAVSALGTYAYARHMKLEPAASFIAAFLFVFGTGYGGAYYNITSLKTISWFPVALLFLEKYIDGQKMRYFIFNGFVLGMALVAGYLQVAALMYFIFLIYSVLRIFLFTETKRTFILAKMRLLWSVILILLLATIVALPQLLLTFNLAMLSNRVALSEEYAYVGSMSPFVLLTLIIPTLQGVFRGNSVYVGLVALLFVIAAFYSPKKDLRRFVYLWLCLTIISFLLAIGRWSPLYVGLIKISHFYSFRTPMKFLVFICFGLSMLGGAGFGHMMKSIGAPEGQLLGRKVAGWYFGIVGLFVLISGVVYGMLTIGWDVSLSAGQWYINQYVFNQPGHPHGMEIYQSKLISSLQTIKSFFSITSIWNAWAYSLLIMSLFVVGWLWFSKKVTHVWVKSSLILLLIDLYIFAHFDIHKDFDTYESKKDTPQIVAYTKKELSTLEHGRVYVLSEPGENSSLMASANLLTDIEVIGAYTPFVLKRYYETIGRLGGIDDSNFRQSPPKSVISDHLNLLAAMDVTHVLSNRRIRDENLQLLFKDPTTLEYLYRNKKLASRAHFVNQVEILASWDLVKEKLMSPKFDPGKSLLLEQSEAEKVNLDSSYSGRQTKAGDLERLEHRDDGEVWSVTALQPGFFVIMNTMYPGWVAKVNDVSVEILKGYGLFQAIWIDKPGTYKVELRYSPFGGLVN